MATNRGIPAHLKCNVCRKIKPSAACFSNSQKDTLKAHMQRNSNFNPARDAYAVCTSCTSQQVVELTCYMCDKTKGLDRFPLAQRRKPDEAECWSCQKERLGQEPDEDSDSGRGDDHDGDEKDSDDDDDFSSGGASLPTDMDNLSITGGGKTYTSNSSITGGVPLSRASQTASTNGASSRTTTTQSARLSSTTSTSTTSVATSNRTIGTNGRGAFNPNAYGRRAPPSEAGSASDPRKFAKVKAVKRELRYDVADQERAEEEAAKAKAAADEDDEYVHVSDDDSDKD